MRILFAQSYQRFLDPKELKQDKPYPALGALYAATHLKRMGHEVFFLDGMFTKSLNDFDRQLAVSKPDICFIYDDEFNYLTKMCLSNMRDAALEMIKKAVTSQIPVFVYSSDAADYPSQYLQAGATAVIYGEGERACWEIIEQTCLNEKIRMESIAGLHYQSNGVHVTNPKRLVMADLDNLPNPDYTLIDISRYQKTWKKHGYFSLNVSTSRGCPYHCNWCAKPLYGQVYYANSPEWVAKEFARLKNDFDVNHIWITDDIFGLKSSWLKNFEIDLKLLNTRIPYKCLSRADLLIRDETVEHLSQSGCKSVWIGAESGSQKILDAMQKGTKTTQIYKATALLRKAGIEVSYFVQFGYSGETWEDILLTRKMIRDNLPDEIGISVSYPLPGTPFYNRVKDELKRKTHWSDSDDLETLFTGTYSKSFYKALHRFVHAEYRFLLAWHKRMDRLIFRLGLYSLRYSWFGLKLALYMLKPSGQKSSRYDVL